jgi:hypothetical protein
VLGRLAEEDGWVLAEIEIAATRTAYWLGASHWRQGLGDLARMRMRMSTNEGPQ